MAYSNFMQKVYSLKWVQSNSSQYYLLDKESMRQIVEILGDGFQLIEGDTELESITIDANGSCTVDPSVFSMISKKGINDVGLFFYCVQPSSSNNVFAMIKMKDGSNKLLASSDSASINIKPTTAFVRSLSENLFSITFKNEYSVSSHYYFDCIAAMGTNQSGEEKLYFLGKSFSNAYVTYFSCDGEIYGPQTIPSGIVNASFYDFIGLQKLTLSNPGVIFNDVFTTTHVDNVFPKLFEINGVKYASNYGYFASNGVYQLCCKCPSE